MTTEYSLNVVKGSDPEMFSIAGIDFSQGAIKSMHFATEVQVRVLFKKTGLTDAEIELQLAKARNEPA